MRTRIVSVLAVTAALTVLGAGMTAYVSERSRILDSVDVQLGESVESLRVLAASAEGGWQSSDQLLEAALQRIAPDDNTGALGVIDGRSAFVPAVAMDVDLTQFRAIDERVSAETANGQVVMGTLVQGDIVFRYVAVPLVVDDTLAVNHTVFVTGYDLTAELAELDAAAQSYLIAGGVGLLLVIVVGLVIAGRLLSPIRELRLLAARIAESGKSERIPVRGHDDVSQLTETVNAMLDRLDESAAAQRRLLDDVGHELKTPITIVRGHLELMDEADPTDVRQVRDVAVAELDRMSGLVQDITRASTLQREDAFVMQPTDMGELVEQIWRKASGIDGVGVQLGATVHTVMSVDAERITQAILQLVQNALTHGAPPVIIGSHRRGDSLLLVVEDHGTGVPDAHKDHVFERFRRVESGRGREGSGLGLAIVATIATAHGGTVAVEDAITGGARFVLALPVTDDDTVSTTKTEE